MTAILILGWALLAAGIVAFFWAGTHKETPKPSPTNYRYRYQGGDAPCVVCGQPSQYSLEGKSLHPGCRKVAGL